jgi:starch phosphorylase
MTKPSKKNPVAYFCAEFGVENKLPIYAGGLGILAGDLLKAASDANFPMIGVGLLYSGRLTVQKVNEDGWQEELDDIINPLEKDLKPVEVNSRPLYVVINLAGDDVWVNAYEKELNENTTLILLTTDNKYNPPVWRQAMVADYCCDDENQLRQQMILGLGGIKMLNAQNIRPSFYHLNEGRPIFLNWQLIHQIMHDKRTPFEKAQKLAKKKTVYTNHTLLKSGNLTFPVETVNKYAAGYVNALGEKTKNLVEPGIDPETKRFSITHFALNISSKTSAVSELHAKLAKKMWSQYTWQTITNGVHLPTWQFKEFEKIDELKDEDIWEVHSKLKSQLESVVNQRTGFHYDTNRLVISWARRVAGYKRLTSLFDDLDRLASILKNPKMPVQLLIAGKGHHGDDAAKKIIQEVIGFMKGKLSGHALFVPNYDIELAQKLVSGSDVWLNTPKYGLEASGTSGMKACANGVINATVADGWANQVDWKDTGWVLDHDYISNSFYSTLENKISKTFYDRDKSGIPLKWTSMMRNSIILARDFSAEKMLEGYKEKLYS